MTLHELAGWILAVFPISEVIIGVRKKATAKRSSVQDQGTLRTLWLVILASGFMASAVSGLPSTKLPLASDASALIAIAITFSGLLLRWISIRTLGRFFTVNVATHPDHEVVTAGPYRLIRHPSYTGLLLAFAGIGIYLDNWLSLLIFVAPIIVAVLHRIKKEEAVLLATLGAPYRLYCSQTKRLLPWLY